MITQYLRDITSAFHRTVLSRRLIMRLSVEAHKALHPSVRLSVSVLAIYSKSECRRNLKFDENMNYVSCHAISRCHLDMSNWVSKFEAKRSRTRNENVKNSCISSSNVDQFTSFQTQISPPETRHFCDICLSVCVSHARLSLSTGAPQKVNIFWSMLLAIRLNDEVILAPETYGH